VGNAIEQKNLAKKLRTEGELDRDATFHFSEYALDHGPVHCVLESAFDLLQVVVCEEVGDAEGFV
jgi:hypothetical protein